MSEVRMAFVVPMADSAKDSSQTGTVAPQKRKMGAQVDAAILAAAIDMLVDRGEAATMNDIANAAGLSRKAVYARYSSRSEIFLDAARDLLENSPVLAVPTEGGPEQRLYRFLCESFSDTALRQARAIHRLFTLDPSVVDVLQPELAGAAARRFLTPLTAFLTEAHETGELQVDDIYETTRTIAKLILIESAIPIAPRDIPQSYEQRERRAHFLASLLCHGLHPRQESVTATA